MKKENGSREFWCRIYGLLINQHKSVGELAAAIGVSYNIIPNWKSKGRFPQVEYLVPMSKFLGLTVDELLENKTDAVRLSTEELKIIQSYRQHPEFHEAIMAMLGVEKKIGSNSSTNAG